VRGIEAGAKALGWKSKVMPLSNTDPGSSLDAAIAEKPDFIGMSGIPAAAIKSQLAKAAAAGIPVVSCGTTDPASADGYAAECQGTLVPMAEYLSRWIAADSNGEANVLAVTLPQFPALVSETEWFKSPAFRQICQNCSFDELGVTGEDLAEGKTGAKLVGYLQTHPEIDYVVFTVGDLATGVLPELKTAGISPSDVKLTAAVENEEVQAAIAKGEFSAATTSPNAYLGMTQIDAMARLSLDGKLSKQYQESIYNSMPTWVVDSPEAAEALGGELWEGPEGFERQFEALWGVH
jgi:ribose transport system substrate-binding protein